MIESLGDTAFVNWDSGLLYAGPALLHPYQCYLVLRVLFCLLCFSLMNDKKISEPLLNQGSQTILSTGLWIWLEGHRLPGSSVSPHLKLKEYGL